MTLGAVNSTSDEGSTRESGPDANVLGKGKCGMSSSTDMLCSYTTSADSL